MRIAAGLARMVERAASAAGGPGAQGSPTHAAPRLGLRAGEQGPRHRGIQGWFGHRSITSTAVYTTLAPNRSSASQKLIPRRQREIVASSCRSPKGASARRGEPKRFPARKKRYRYRLSVGVHSLDHPDGGYVANGPCRGDRHSIHEPDGRVPACVAPQEIAHARRRCNLLSERSTRWSRCCRARRRRIRAF
jgi:hypothetical protein